jgi:DNA (cytosine-5)-methyltransferase 1
VARRAIDLFSGAGGMTLGLKQAGFMVIGAVEIDGLAAETYRINHPEIQLWEEDISKLRAPTLMRKLGLAAGELDCLPAARPVRGSRPSQR